MPSRAPHICACGKVVPDGTRCACQARRDHERDAYHDARRPTARARGYTSKWQRESKAFLTLPEHHHCACGCGRVADMVDHIKPHLGNMRLFWDRKNWQPMAASPCHSSKKQSEERRHAHSQDR